MGTETLYDKNCPFAMQYDNTNHTFYFVCDPFEQLGRSKRIPATPTDWLLFNIYMDIKNQEKPKGFLKRLLGL